MALRHIRRISEMHTRLGATPERSVGTVAGHVSEAGHLSLGTQLLRLRTLLSFAIAGLLIAYVFARQDIPLAQVWANVRRADMVLLLLGVVSYYASFYVRTLRWQQMLRNAGYGEHDEAGLPGTRVLNRIILLSWLANSILPAKLGDGYRAYLLKRSAQVSFARTMGTILAERIVDVAMLFSLLLLSCLLAFRDQLPPNFLTLVAFGATLVVVSLGALVLLRYSGPFVSRLLPHRLRSGYARLTEGALLAFRGGLGFTLGLTAAIWILESLRFWFVAASLGTHLDLPLVIFVALAASLLTTVPFTPAGLGVVEGAVIAVLLWVRVDGLPLDEALVGTIAILDRAITYWSLLLVGAAVYVIHHRTRKNITNP